MARNSTLVLWFSIAAWTSSLGCTMCSQEHMWDYGGVGGKWQRGNPTCGRVGSVLSDAGGFQSGSTVEFGSNYGQSWQLVEEPDMAAPPENQITEGELFEEEPGAIMIGP